MAGDTLGASEAEAVEEELEGLRRFRGRLDRTC